MTWNDFNALCARGMGDYCSVILFTHVPPTEYHAAVVLHQEGWPASATNTATYATPLEALSAGMDVVRRIIGVEIETGGWRE